ncbi:DUF7409 domain-containing protein [Halobellus limi]|uniref:DUF7409 domain-containing protein n=1 Tax=Halobellus limi TaxID=699433 RepID=A0A1H6AZ46_9EURY|nr:helix-hairpin-helix domain-containing protein [Halobellus limi]SEG53307.1 hypothetical protein SAMN04488133_2577 [Halobellus limi]
MTEDEGDERAFDAGESDATAEEGSGWSAVPDVGDDDLEIPLPWNTVSGGGSDPDGIETGNADEADSGSADEADRGTAGEVAGDEGGDGEAPTESGEETADPETFEDVRFVGPKSAAVLRDSAVSLSDLVEKRVAYRDLTEAGVNPGVAAKIRREHSLSWSLDGGGTDLDRRSTQVRGLDDDERAWIAASSGWSDESAATETDGSGDATEAEAAWRARTDDAATPSGGEDRPQTAGEAAWRDGTGAGVGASESDESVERSDVDAESAWREQSVPTPVTALDDIDERAAATLRRAGIGSVRRLATADPESVADALELGRDEVETWCRLAREHE